MSIAWFIRPLIVGFLHAFEPDHVSAVSVLATETAIAQKKVTLYMVFRSSQWALGHAVTLLLFGSMALVFRNALAFMIYDLSAWVELLIGPLMIWLGSMSIRRNYTLNRTLGAHKRIDPHDHTLGTPIHLHGTRGEEVAMNPMKKSFWVGMVHGLAGTGGVLTSALVMSTASIWDAMAILIIESAGIVVAMGVYSYVMMRMVSKFLERNIMVFKWINAGVGLVSIGLGSWLLYHNVIKTIL